MNNIDDEKKKKKKKRKKPTEILFVCVLYRVTAICDQTNEIEWEKPLKKQKQLETIHIYMCVCV